MIPSLIFALQTMTLEEKAGQVLMVGFKGNVPNEEALTLIQDTKVGGIIYYNWSNDLGSPEQVKTLSAGLQDLAGDIPLLIAADQEGGKVARLKNGFTLSPGNEAIAAVGDPNVAEQMAFVMGCEMHDVGVNMNLAPVVDINSNPNNPIIGSRSFGNNPDTVSIFGQKAVDGYKKAHVITTLKHFPGHGDVEVDSHLDLPIINKSLEELERVELVPFIHLSASADAMMMAHLLVPALDAENCSSLSEKTISYLRKDVGFEGLIITDSLVMEGVLKQCLTVDEAAIRALNAGNDMLIIGGKLLIGQDKVELTSKDIQRIHRSIIEAVRTNRLPESRLDAAVTKILHLKQKLAKDA